MPLKCADCGEDLEGIFYIHSTADANAQVRKGYWESGPLCKDCIEKAYWKQYQLNQASSGPALS